MVLFSLNALSRECIHDSTPTTKREFLQVIENYLDEELRENLLACGFYLIDFIPLPWVIL